MGSYFKDTRSCYNNSFHVAVPVSNLTNAIADVRENSNRISYMNFILPDLAIEINCFFELSTRPCCHHNNIAYMDIFVPCSFKYLLL